MTPSGQCLLLLGLSQEVRTCGRDGIMDLHCPSGIEPMMRDEISYSSGDLRKARISAQSVKDQHGEMFV